MSDRQSIAGRIEELKTQLVEAESEHQNAEEIQRELLHQQHVLNKQLREIQDLISSNKATLWGTSKAVKQLTTEVESEQRTLHRIEVEEKAAQDLEERGFLLDIITGDAKWRKQFKDDEGAYDHQLSGAKQLAVVRRGLLGDERGLGKTLTSIIWADMLQANKVVFFVPKQTAVNFHNEIPRWCGKDRPVFNFVTIPKIQRDQLLMLIDRLDSWNIVINLEAWRKDPELLDKIVELQPEAVVIDEAHYIKSASTAAFRGVSKVVYTPNNCTSCGNRSFRKTAVDYVKKWQCQSCKKVFELSDDSILSVKYTLPMTGTPILNRPDELFTNLHLIDRTSFPTIDKFRTDFLRQDFEGKWRFRHGGQDAIVEKLGMRFVQRKSTDTGIEIPPPTIEVIELDFNPADYPQQWKAYWELEHRHALLLEESSMPVVAYIAVLTRQRQMITWPAGIELRDPETKELLFRCNVEESIKVDRASDLLTELNEEGLRSVAFSQFRAPLHEINRRLRQKGIRSAVFDGTTPDHLKQQIIEDLDAHYTKVGNHKYDVVLCGYKVGGQSLNFTGVSDTLIIDREWNPGKEDQAIGRTNRIGQVHEKTRVHVLRALPSIDEWLDGLIEHKGEITEQFEGAAKAKASLLSYFKGK